MPTKPTFYPLLLSVFSPSFIAGYSSLPVLCLILLLSHAYIIYALHLLSCLVHSSASCFWLSSSSAKAHGPCIRWFFRSMCGSHQGAFSWFILLDCAVIVLRHSSLKGAKRPSFRSELKFFSPHVSILFMGK